VKKLILHVGLHKTATTSLQDFLRDNMGKLLNQGTQYFPLKRMRSEITPLMISAGREEQVSLKRIFKRFSKSKFLLSDENIVGSPSDILTGTLYPFSESRILRICKEFSDSEIRIFVTLRRPAAFLTSMYCEYLRQNPFMTFDAYVENFDTPAFSYAKIFDWIRELPNNSTAVFTPFEKELGGGIKRITDDLLTAACGVDHGVDLSTFPDSKSRSSFSHEEIELANEVANRVDPDTARFFLNMLDNRNSRFGSTRFDPLPADLVAELDERYSKDLETLRQG